MLHHPRAESVEAAGGDGDVVKDKGVEDDPHHRNERESRAVGDAAEGLRRGEFPNSDGDDESGEKPPTGVTS